MVLGLCFSINLNFEQTWQPDLVFLQQTTICRCHLWATCFGALTCAALVIEAEMTPWSEQVHEPLHTRWITSRSASRQALRRHLISVAMDWTHGSCGRAQAMGHRNFLSMQYQVFDFYSVQECRCEDSAKFFVHTSVTMLFCNWICQFGRHVQSHWLADASPDLGSIWLY